MNHGVSIFTRQCCWRCVIQRAHIRREAKLQGKRHRVPKCIDYSYRVSITISNGFRQSLLQGQYHFPRQCWALFCFIRIVSNSHTEVDIKVVSAWWMRRLRMLTSSARSKTVWYSVYVAKFSVWNLQPRPPWRGSNRFCAKRHPFSPLEHSGMTRCDRWTSLASLDKSSFLLRYREQHVQLEE